MDLVQVLIAVTIIWAFFHFTGAFDDKDNIE